MKAEIQMDCYGNFRIIVDGQESQPAMYNSVASLTVDGKTYIGVSAYYEGVLPAETVLEVTEVESTKADTPECNLFRPEEECTHRGEDLIVS